MANARFSKPTLRTFLSGAALAAFLLFAASASARYVSAAWHGAQQNNAQANEVSGKVTSIAPDKKSISLEVTGSKSPTRTKPTPCNSPSTTARVSLAASVSAQWLASNTKVQTTANS